MLVMERIIDEIAHFLKLDPLMLRKRNFYADRQKSSQQEQETPYGQNVRDCVINDLIAKLEKSTSTNTGLNPKLTMEEISDTQHNAGTITSPLCFLVTSFIKEIDM